MKKGATGASTGSIQNTNKVKSIGCNCATCFHILTIKHNGRIHHYCKHKCLPSPKVTRCARYSYMEPYVIDTRGNFGASKASSSERNYYIGLANICISESGEDLNIHNQNCRTCIHTVLVRMNKVTHHYCKKFNIPNANKNNCKAYKFNTPETVYPEEMNSRESNEIKILKKKYIAIANKCINQKTNPEYKKRKSNKV